MAAKQELVHVQEELQQERAVVGSLMLASDLASKLDPGGWEREQKHEKMPLKSTLP